MVGSVPFSGSLDCFEFCGIRMVSLHGVIVYDEAYYGKRIMSLFYDCTWDEEEGMGIRIALGNNVSEVKIVKIGNIGYAY